MKTQLWTNTSNKPVFRGGMRIQSGETRELPVHLIPADAVSPQTSADDRTTVDQEDWSAEGFLNQSLRDMEDAGLAEFDIAQLTELKKLETDTQNRQNVLTSIDAALLKQAK